MFMTQDVLNFVKEKTEALMAALSCSREAKEAAKAWLDAVGTDKEAEETKKYIQELEGDIMPIDMLIDFAQSPQGQLCLAAALRLWQIMPKKSKQAAQNTATARHVRQQRPFLQKRMIC